jgi:hypothetical protein
MVQARAMSTIRSTDLTELMNVGPAVARYLQRADIAYVDQLAGRDPVEIYETICEHDAQRYDPCLLDTIISAVDQANGNPARPWWTYTPQRKRLTSARD